MVMTGCTMVQHTSKSCTELVKGLVEVCGAHYFIFLHCFLLEKAVYELDYELNNRPEWVIIPVRGIKHIVKHLLRKEVV
jgi:predicted trehalose synthase